MNGAEGPAALRPAGGDRAVRSEARDEERIPFFPEEICAPDTIREREELTSRRHDIARNRPRVRPRGIQVAVRKQVLRANHDSADAARASPSSR